MDFNALSAKFKPDEIDWRIGMSGQNSNGVWAKALAYIDARALRKRLNYIAGPANWQTKFHSVGGGVCCELFLRVNDEWIVKSDGSGETDFEGVKGSFSGSFKRSCYSWGMGEYLYDLPETWVETSLTKKEGWNHQSKSKNGKTPAFYWKKPSLPSWALPAGQKKQVESVERQIYGDNDMPKNQEQAEKTELPPPGKDVDPGPVACKKLKRNVKLDFCEECKCSDLDGCKSYHREKAKALAGSVGEDVPI